jgi:hypothetical protein
MAVAGGGSTIVPQYRPHPSLRARAAATARGSRLASTVLHDLIFVALSTARYMLQMLHIEEIKTENSILSVANGTHSNIRSNITSCSFHLQPKSEVY